jgi:Neisseria PilC beta-propeller domain
MNPNPHPPTQRGPGRPWRRFAFACVAAAAGLTVTATHAQFSAGKEPVAWQAPLDFSTYNLAGGLAVAFRGDYIRSTWDGDLVAHNVSSTGAFSVKWRAREQVPLHGSRIIFTSSVSATGVAFRWSGASAISTAQQALLGDATSGPQVLNYLRGDTSNEISSTKPYPTGFFRPRFSRLGAVVHSRPFFNGNLVYVGANDGMLHAFDAATGVERWAYVPSMLLEGGLLKSLTTPFTTDFPYLVDGSMAIGTVGSMKLLVGALGSGGKGLYALDITNPLPASETAAAAMAKWEITGASTNYANLGNVMSPPQIVKLNGGTEAVLVPNGLNSTGKVSSLFVIRASDGVRLAEIAAGTALADGTANGLGGIAAVDRDNNGTVDVVYAGDLKGTLWKFDLSSTTLPTSATALFTPAIGDERPITAAPSISLHPRGGLLVNFGTGKVYNSADLSSTATEYLYGVWDSGTSTSANLVTQTLTNRTVPATTMVVRTASANAVSYSGSNKGWRIALTGGERLIGGDLLTDGGRFTVTTTVPNTGGTQGSWLMQVNALTGSAPTAPFFDLNNDGAISATGTSDRIVVTSTLAEVPVAKFLGGGVWSQPVLAQVDTTLDLPFFNYNANGTLPPYTTVYTPPPPPPPPPTSGGVAGGHFDFDIFYQCSNSAPVTKDNCSKDKHTHEYDDKWGVVGVNMLNASTPDYNLSNAITSTTSPSFKILVSNTRWSPGAALKVGSSISGLGWKLPVSPEGFLAETDGGPAKVFTRATLSDFIFVLPINAFSNRDWGTGQVRAGLIPTQTSCMQANANPSTAWMDGAFTIQVVNNSAGGSDVQASQPADSGGYRLKDNNSARGKLLAQYSAFWHHPNDLCKTHSGWTMAPPPDTSAPAAASTPPAGTADPKGDFARGVIGDSTGGGGGGTGPGTIKYYYQGVEVLVNQSFDGNGVRQVITNLGGSVLNDSRSDFSVIQKGSLQQGLKPRLGRLGWKEIVR